MHCKSVNVLIKVYTEVSGNRHGDC